MLVSDVEYELPLEPEGKYVALELDVEKEAGAAATSPEARTAVRTKDRSLDIVDGAMWGKAVGYID